MLLNLDFDRKRKKHKKQKQFAKSSLATSSGAQQMTIGLC